MLPPDLTRSFSRLCLCLLVTLAHAPLSSCAPADDVRIVQTVIISRHSVRNVDHSSTAQLGALLVGGKFPHLKADDNHAATLGQLTAIGKKKAKDGLGAELKKRYIDELKLLPARLDESNFWQLKLRSSRVPRCVESLSLVLEKMYPDVRVLPLFAESEEAYKAKLQDGQHPVSKQLHAPGEDVYKFLDPFLATEWWRPGDARFIYKTIEEMQQASRVKQPLVLPIECRSGPYENLLPPYSRWKPLIHASKAQAAKEVHDEAERILDSVDQFIPKEEARKLNMREFLEVALGNDLELRPGIDKDAMFKVFCGQGVLQYELMNANKAYKADGAGVMLDQTMAIFEAKMSSSGAADAPSAVLMWAHDVTLNVYMSMFGGFGDRSWPHYNDHIAAELWKGKGPDAWYVRLRYNDKLLQIPEAADPDPDQPDKTLHPWKQFLDFYGPQRHRRKQGETSGWTSR